MIKVRSKSLLNKQRMSRAKSTKEIKYDGNIGQRLYAKNRGLSVKREKSLKNMRRHNQQKTEEPSSQKYLKGNKLVYD